MKVSFLSSFMALMLSLCLVSCATVPTDPLERAEYYRTNDPLEPYNRAAFATNEWLDDNVMKPLSDVYGYIPSFVRNRIDNLLDFFGTPLEFVNYVLQGRRTEAGNALGRILLNGVVGLGGLFDVATSVGVPRQSTDFGITLGVWGVGEGPYIILPILGPNTLRSVVGRGVEYVPYAFTPMPYTSPTGLIYEHYGVDFEAGMSTALTAGLNARYNLGDQLDSLKRDSLDYYASVRSFYRQYRRGLVGAPLEEENLFDDGYDDLAPALSPQEDYDMLGPPE